MKKAFKITSGAVIAWSAYCCIAYFWGLLKVSDLMEAAANHGYGSSVIGIAGTLVNIALVIGLVVAGLMLYMGICGVRGLVDRCQKISKGLLIFYGICTAITIIGKNFSATSLITIGALAVYYYMASKYPINDFDDSFYY